MTPPICKTTRVHFPSRPKCRNTVYFLVLMFALGAFSSRAQTPPAAQASTSLSNSSMEALSHARKAVQQLFERSANMICTESVTQSILDKEGNPFYREQSLFNYRIQTDTSGNSLKFVESRERLQAPFRDPNRTVLVTDGFGNMLLILHPAFEMSYKFEADGEELITGTNTVRLRFRSVPGASSPLMLQVRGQNYSVPLYGTVWIEPQSGAVVKLMAFSGSSLGDLGIQSMSSQIQYRSADLHNPEESYWMPASAVIDVETAHRHWRNIHRFTAYERFHGTSAREPGKNP